MVFMGPYEALFYLLCICFLFIFCFDGADFFEVLLLLLPRRFYVGSSSPKGIASEKNSPKLKMLKGRSVNSLIPGLLGSRRRKPLTRLLGGSL